MSKHPSYEQVSEEITCQRWRTQCKEIIQCWKQTTHHITSCMQKRWLNCNRLEDALDIQMLIWTLSEQFRCFSSTTQSYGFYYSLLKLLKCCCMKFINIPFSSGWKNINQYIDRQKKEQSFATLKSICQSLLLFYHLSVAHPSIHLSTYVANTYLSIYL